MGKVSRKKKKVSGEISVGEGSTKSSRMLTKKNPAHRTEYSKYYFAVSVSLVTFLVYLKSLQNEFINWDDPAYVFRNPYIYSFKLTFFKWAFFDFYQANWHPLTWISHALDYAIWGLNPLGHHLTNNILHAVNTFIVVLLIIRLIEIYKERAIKEGTTKSLDERQILIAGGVTGLLFGLHPVHVESVAWITERKDLLCALFFLVSIMAFAQYVNFADKETFQKEAKSWFLNKHYLFSLCFFTLALLSKPMAISLPLVLLILDWYPFKRIQSFKTFGTAFIDKLPFILLSLMSAVLTILAQKAGKAMQLMEFVPLSSRVLVAVKSLIAYLWKMIFPMNLIPYYSYPKDVSFIGVEYILAIVFAIGITVACVMVVKTQRLFLSVWGYYVVTLIPVLGVVQVGGQAMADRYTYLPSLGPFLLMGIMAAKLYGRVTALKGSGMILKVAGLFIAIAMLVLISYATAQQISVWRNSIVFWNYVIEQEPLRNAFAYNSLGDAYFSKGQIDMAIEQYQTSLRLEPNYSFAHNNLCIAYSSKGRLDMALEQCETALRLNPDYAEAHFNLGNVYLSKSQFDMALEQYQTALRLKPDYVEVHFNLCMAYLSKGQFDMALEKCETALRLKPDYAEAYNLLGIAYQSKGQLDMAIEQYQTALRLKPEYAEAHFNLGLICLNKGLRDVARTEFELGLKSNPTDYRARQVLNSIISK